MKKLFFILIFLPAVSFANWQMQYSSGYVTDINCTDSLHAWAAELKMSGNKKDFNRILFNNGISNTWTEKPTSVTSDSSYFISKICFANSLKGYFGGSRTGLDPQTGSSCSNYLFAYTSDGCLSTYVAGTGSISHYLIGGVFDIETAQGRFFRAYYMDDMLTWGWDLTINEKLLTMPSAYGGAPVSLCFVDSLRGWVCSTCEYNKWYFFRTTTGINGLTHVYNLPGIIAVDFPDTLHGWGIGDSGRILYSDNGGADSIWQPESSGVTNKLLCVDFVDSLNGWVGGANIILRTRDGGQTWSTETSPGSGDVTKLCFIDTSCGWAIQGGSIIKYQIGPAIEESKELRVESSEFKIIKNKILLSIPNPTIAELKLFDLAGRLEETIYSGTLSAGNYTFASKIRKKGVYFVKLETRNYNETRKLILIK